MSKPFAIFLSLVILLHAELAMACGNAMLDFHYDYPWARSVLDACVVIFALLFLLSFTGWLGLVIWRRFMAKEVGTTAWLRTQGAASVLMVTAPLISVGFLTPEFKVLAVPAGIFGAAVLLGWRKHLRSTYPVTTKTGHAIGGAIAIVLSFMLWTVTAGLTTLELSGFERIHTDDVGAVKF